jgi:CRP/FNR family cyclic AMP-dependent transcriptional regulator
VIPTLERVEFLRKIHLFHGLKDEDLTSIAEKMDEQMFGTDQEIFHQGQEGDRFFIIYTGKVRVLRREGGKERELASRVDFDTFGESSVLNHNRHSATVLAAEETLLLTLSRPRFQELVKTIPELHQKFEVSINTHRMEHRLRFTWLEEGEGIFFLARRHIIELWRGLTGPVLALILPGVLLILYGLTATPLLLYLAGAAFLAALLWIGWRALDWSNDYYIVTNRRVIWLEKVIGLYDSRQEAPLTAVLSVNSETDVTGRLLGYGDVIIRTFVGKITFASVGSPTVVEDLVRERWDRNKEVSRQANVGALKQAIRQKLGLQPPQPAAPAPKVVQKPLYRPDLLRILFANLFKLRFEESGTIVYRKHLVVLFEQTWVPGLLFLGIFSWLLYNLFTGPVVFGTLETTLVIFLVFLGLWWLYQYVDWKNDIFQVTSDQIMDVDKTPLGKVQKNVAPLDNILSMEARREGLLQVLFNYGNVYITVGSSQMVFENVMDPSAVQQDIDRRRVARRDKQEQDQALAERDRLAEFFAMYHNQADELRQELEARKQALPSPDPTAPETEVK